MGQNQDDAGADAAEKSRRPSKIIRYDHRLAMTWHERMDHAEDGSKRHRGKEPDGAEITGESSQFGGRRAIEPALNIAKELHHRAVT